MQLQSNAQFRTFHYDVNTKLLPRKSLIRSLEDTYKTTALRPKNVAVQLHDKSFITLPVFDTKTMIINLLTDNTLMKEYNWGASDQRLTKDKIQDKHSCLLVLIIARYS